MNFYKALLGAVLLTSAFVDAEPTNFGRPGEKLYLRHRASGQFLCLVGPELKLATPDLEAGVTPALIELNTASSWPKFVDPQRLEQRIPRPKDPVAETVDEDWAIAPSEGVDFQYTDLGSFHLRTQDVYLSAERRPLAYVGKIPSTVQLVPGEHSEDRRYLQAPYPLLYLNKDEKQAFDDGFGLLGWAFPIPDNHDIDLFGGVIVGGDGTVSANPHFRFKLKLRYAPSVRIPTNRYREHKNRFEATLFQIHTSGDGSGLYLYNHLRGILIANPSHGEWRLGYRGRDLKKASVHSVFDALTPLAPDSLKDENAVGVRLIDYRFRALVTPKPGETELRFSGDPGEWSNTLYAFQSKSKGPQPDRTFNLMSMTGGTEKDVVLWIGDHFARPAQTATVRVFPRTLIPYTGGHLRWQLAGDGFRIQDIHSERFFEPLMDGTLLYGATSTRDQNEMSVFRLLRPLQYTVSN
jgi:hypothetical protein